jgi:hypothetical protein
MKKNKIHIVLPSVSNDVVSKGLYKLSEALGKMKPKNQHHGFLGGDWGYGQDFENKVFQMFPFYWGECTCGYDKKASIWYRTHRHKKSCYQAEYVKISGAWMKDKEVKKLCKKFGISWDKGAGSAVHCTCGFDKLANKWERENPHKSNCLSIRPNFVHKPTGFSVNWYKYIGRSMENEKISEGRWKKILNECLKSLEKKGAKNGKKKGNAR